MFGSRESDESRRLCAVLGHELRNPLASAMTNVSVAAAMLDGDDPRAGHLQRATQDLERLASLLTTYLEFGRSGKVARRRIDLVEVVRAIASRNQCARLEVSVESAGILGDAELLGRAIENMIENAVLAGASRVTIRVARRDGAAVVDVCDDGPGVPTEIRDTLFEPFVSGRSSSGLGLAVTRDAIEKLGGHVMLVESSRKGSRFRLILPVAVAPEAVAPGAVAIPAV